MAGKIKKAEVHLGGQGSHPYMWSCPKGLSPGSQHFSGEAGWYHYQAAG